MCCLLVKSASGLPAYKFEDRAESSPSQFLSRLVLDVQQVADSTLVDSVDGDAVDGWSMGLGSNSGVGILDEYLLSHEKGHQTTKRLAEIESPSLPLVSILGLGGRRA